MLYQLSLFAGMDCCAGSHGPISLILGAQAVASVISFATTTTYASGGSDD